jgi:hypothetical protein
VGLRAESPKKTVFPRLRWLGLAWLAVWAPSYAIVWGWRNFLQLCDVSVFLTCLGFWRGSPLLLSSQAIGSIVVDGIWALDAGARLFSGRHLIGGTEYMWDETQPLLVRLMSLFHVALPPLLVWSLRKTGYDRRGWVLQAAIAAVLLVASRTFGDSGKNLNFAFKDPFFHRAWGSAPQHLVLTWAVLVGAVFFPTHLGLRRLFGRR